MGDANMIIKVQADVVQATTALNNVQKSLAQTAVSAQKMDSSVASSGKGFDNLRKGLPQVAQAAAGLGGEFGNIAASLVGGGLITGIATLGISLITLALNTEKSDAEITKFESTLQKFDKTISDSKVDLKDFNTEMEYLNKLNAINIKIAFDDKFKANLTTLQGGIISLLESEEKIGKEADKLRTNASAAYDYFFSTASFNVKKLIGVYGELENIPKAALKKLDEDEQQKIQGVVEANKALLDTEKQLSDVRNKRSLTAAEIRLAKTVKSRESVDVEVPKATVVPKEVDIDIKRAKVSTTGIEGFRIGIPKIYGEDKAAREREIKKAEDESRAYFSDRAQELVKPVDFPITLKPVVTIEDTGLQDVAVEIESTVSNALAGVGEAIGDTIANGTNLFGNLFKVIAAGMKQLGTQMITLGTAALALKKLTINPLLSIAAGIALVALSSVANKAIPQFATGVQNFRGGVALVGERGRELVNLPKGSDVLTNHQSMNIGRSDIVIPDVKIQGQDLVLVFKRASQTISRNG